MTLPLQTRSYLDDLYPQALSAIWTFYDRVRNPSYAQAQDVDAWEVLQRDPKIYQGIQERRHAVAGPNWRMFPFNNSKEPADIAVAKIAEDAFRRVPHLTDVRLRLTKAIFVGQAMEMQYGKRMLMNLGGLGPRMWWMPTQFKQIDHRRIAIRPARVTKPDGSTRVRGELWMATIPMQTAYRATEGPHPEGPPRDKSASTVTLQNYRKIDHPEWFIRIVYDDEESRLGFGRGILDALYFYSWVKTVLIREGLQGVERWSQGIVHGKLDTDRLGATDTQTMTKERDAMIASLTAMRARHVLVTGKHDEVEILTGGGEGASIVMQMIDYVDDCIMAVCTGAVLMSSKSNAGSLGSLSRDEVGRDTQRGVILYDQNKVDEDVTLDGVGLFTRMNRRNFIELGLADAGPPQFKTVGAKHVDPDRAMSRFAQLASIATNAQEPISVRKDEVYEQIDLTPPGPDDDVITFAPPAPMGGPGELRGPAGQFAPGGPGGGEGGAPGVNDGGSPTAMRVRFNALPYEAKELFRAYRRGVHGKPVDEDVALGLAEDFVKHFGG